MGNLFDAFYSRHERLQRIAHFLFEFFVRPRSRNDESWRKEFILNVILLSTIGILAVFGIILIHNSIVQGSSKDRISLSLFFSIFGLIVFLYSLSRAGYYKAVSYVLVIVLFLSSALNNYHWGIDVPDILLSYGFLIVMTGILINSKAAIVMAVVIGATLNEIAYLQLSHIIHVSSHWRTEMFTQRDATEFFLYLLIIAAVSWLSNREIDRSMHRAFRTERALLRQREDLEELVERRTNELREAQIQRVEQLYRFAEFGKLSSGFFHDLSNPLATLRLYLDDIELASSAQVAEFQADVKKAIGVASHIEKFTRSMKDQLRESATNQDFSVKEEIQNVLQMMNHRILSSNIEVTVDCFEEISMIENPLRFHQVISNLVSNAIDAYAGMDITPKTINVVVTANEKVINIIVEDHGKGFDSSTQNHIFEPFFTTKSNTTNMGIGLATTKTIVEKDFGGTISAQSSKGSTRFTVVIPKHVPEIA